MPRRAKKRCSSADTVRPASAKAMRSSSSEMSLRASHKAKMPAARYSTRRDRMSPLCGLGAKAPVSRHCANQRMAVDGASPKRFLFLRLDGLQCADPKGERIIYLLVDYRSATIANKKWRLYRVARLQADVPESANSGRLPLCALRPNASAIFDLSHIFGFREFVG